MTVTSIVAGATPTLLVPAGNRDFIHIYNNGTAKVFLSYDGEDQGDGASNPLTIDNGLPLEPGDTLILNNDGNRNVFNKEIWGITADASDQEMRIQGV